MPKLIPEKNDSVQTLLNKFLESQNANLEEQALATAARTATTQSADIDMDGYAGVTIVLFVSAASGTGGLTIRLRGLVFGTYVNLGLGASPVTTITHTVVQFGPGIGAGLGGAGGLQSGAVPVRMPSVCRVEIVHADASSYTYSVSIVKHGK